MPGDKGVRAMGSGQNMARSSLPLGAYLLLRAKAHTQDKH